MLNAFESFEECERDRKFTNKRFLNHKALVRVGQIRHQLSKFIKRWNIEETSARENVFPVLKVFTQKTVSTATTKIRSKNILC